MSRTSFSFKKIFLCLIFFYFLCFLVNGNYIYATKDSDFTQQEETPLMSRDLTLTKSDVNKNKLNKDSKTNNSQELIPLKAINSSIVKKELLQDPNILELEQVEYHKNINQKRLSIGFRHDWGSAFSSRTKLFYEIPTVKTMPCASFQEWLNFKQLFFYALNYHIPKMDFLFDFIDFSGIKDTFIDDKYDRIALETTSFYRLLKKDPSLGFFYFSDKDKKTVKKVNIAFCNCKVSGYSILELIFEMIHFQDYDIQNIQQHLMLYFQDLVKLSDQKEILSEDLHISIEEFIDRIFATTEIELLDKKILFQLIKNLSSVFLPKNFLLHCSIDHANVKPLKEMTFDISDTLTRPTIGFMLKIEHDKEKNFYLHFYEIFQDEITSQEKLRLIDKVLILSHDNQNLFFNHLSINVSKQKTKFFWSKGFLLGAMKK